MTVVAEAVAGVGALLHFILSGGRVLDVIKGVKGTTCGPWEVDVGWGWGDNWDKMTCDEVEKAGLRADSGVMGC